MTTPQKPQRQPRAKTETPYHWFQGASVRRLVDQLLLAGPDTARLEVRTEGDKMLFRVVAASENGAGVQAESAVAADINDSFLCPPRCPK